MLKTMVKCVECGWDGCELAYTGEPDPLCCACFLKVFPTFDHGNCPNCDRLLRMKEKILKQQTSLENFLRIPKEREKNV